MERQEKISHWSLMAESKTINPAKHIQLHLNR